VDNQTDSDTDQTQKMLQMPMSYGIGFAYRFSDNFTFSFDVYKTEWDDFVYKDENGHSTSAVTGKPIHVSEIDPTHQIRFGAEYLFIIQPEYMEQPKYVVPLRGGIFYDPAPAPGNPDHFYGFSIGSGISVRQFVFDIGYQFKYARNVREFIVDGFGFSQNVYEHIVYSSLILHF
jgi:hypothetical protein